MDEIAQMSTTYRHESFICPSVLGIILSLISSVETHFHLIPFFHANDDFYVCVYLSMCIMFINEFFSIDMHKKRS